MAFYVGLGTLLGALVNKGLNDVCALDCRKPDVPDNGTVVTPSGTTFGETAVYVCNAGFDLIGTNTSECQDSGSWSGSTPSCTIKGKTNHNKTIIEPLHEISSNVVCVTSKGSEPLLVAWIFYEC